MSRTEAAPQVGGARLNGGRQLTNPLPTRQRKPGYVALAVALIVGLASLGGYLLLRAGAKTPVVMVVSEVPAGQVVERADLTTVDVAGAVTAVAGANLDSVVGQYAAVPLLPNTLLQRAMLSVGDPIGGNEAQVGVALQPGQMPADELRPGDLVEVLRLPAKDGTGTTSAEVLVYGAEVFTARADSSQAGGVVVTLVVPRDTAPAVAAASGTNTAALVKVGGR